MNNLLARGGIEFLAVFLGIGLSFYVEGWQTENDNERKKDQYLSDMVNTLEMDISQINKLLETLYQSDRLITEIQSDIEPVYYILENVTIPSHKAKSLFGSGSECLHGNGTLETWVVGHYEALDYVSKN